MLMTIVWVVLAVGVTAVAFILRESMTRGKGAADGAAARGDAERLLEEARNKSELLIKEAELKAKDLTVEARAEAERELRERRREANALETKLQSREETLEKRLEAFERREADLNRRDQVVSPGPRATASTCRTTGGGSGPGANRGWTT